jgi:hypothetical protein
MSQTVWDIVVGIFLKILTEICGLLATEVVSVSLMGKLHRFYYKGTTEQDKEVFSLKVKNGGTEQGVSIIDIKTNKVVESTSTDPKEV